MILVFCGLLVCSMQVSSACTAVYVGPDVSADGSLIFGRSNDFHDVWANNVVVTPRVENSPGRLMPVSIDGSVKTEIPATTYQYTSTPFMNSTTASNGYTHDAAACTNEYGVAITMSVTAFANNASLGADPLVEGGLAEFSTSDLVICQSKTAREGVDVLLGLVDKYGSSESNIAIIADQNEVWYVEIYTGHQYAAVKMPRDKVSVFGNEYSLEYLSDYDEVITSKNLTSLPEERGFAVHGNNGELNLYDTYSGKEVTDEYSHMRTWAGHRIMSPSNYTTGYHHNAKYPLCFTPDSKISVENVSQILRNRFEGTIFSPDEIGRIDMRVIGTDTALSAHIIQIFSDVPADMSCVSWISSGPPIYGIFVPLSNDCINVSDAYGSNQPANKTNDFDTEHYPYYVFKELSTRCVGPKNYKIYGEPVRDYWHEAECNMFDGMSKVMDTASKMDNNTRANYLTSYCNDMQSKAFDDRKVILNELRWAKNKNSNTLQLDHNPETGRFTGQKVVIPPMEVHLDASKYKYVPPAN